jgi:hypothetical protein
MTAPPRTANDIWPEFRARAHALIATLLARALPAAFVAGEPFLSRAEVRAVLAWLRPIERLVRVVILLQAAMFPDAPARERRARERRSSWGARAEPTPPTGPVFRVPLVEGEGGTPPSALGCKRERPESVPAWPLMVRVEAMLDAIVDPAPHVRRVARRMGRVEHEDRPASRNRPSTKQRRHPSVRRGPDPTVEAERLIALVEALDTS